MKALEQREAVIVIGCVKNNPTLGLISLGDWSCELRCEKYESLLMLTLGYFGK